MFYNKVLFVLLIIFEMYLYMYIMYSVIDIFMGNLVGLSEDNV